jgi:hypothetical protein
VEHPHNILKKPVHHIHYTLSQIDVAPVSLMVIVTAIVGLDLGRT